MAGDIWLADLARALAVIRPQTNADARSITRLLGFAAPLRDEEEAAPVRPGTATDISTPAEPDVEVTDDFGPSPDVFAPADLPVLTPVARQPVKAVGWGVQSLERVNASQLGNRPAREPLLAPRGSAALLQMMTARNAPEGPLDVPAIVDLLARRQVVERLPRQSRPTLRFGVQVLVDRGPAMQPFAGDQAQLVAQLQTVTGKQRTSVRYFRDAPGRGAGPGPRRTWRPYQPPERGTRVLVLSDFGLAGPPLYPHRSEPEEWAALVRDLGREECHVVALLPVPADRWPRWLSALMPLVCWDRGTTAGKVAASLSGW